MTTIIYYDMASEYYLAYVLDGLMTKAASFKCKIRISKSEPPLFQHINLPTKDTSRMFALGLFQINTGNTSKWFCIDAHDDSGPEGYFRPILEKVDYYFKLNCNPKVFEEDAALAPYETKILSLGCAFALRPSNAYRFFPRLKQSKVYGWDWFSIKRRLLALRRHPNLQWYRAMRAMQPDKDVFLVRRYYREAGHARSNEECLKIVESIKRIEGLTGYIGFTGITVEPPKCFREHAIGPDRTLRDHLHLMARSRVCIYMPGTYNCLSFKFGQYLALGKPVIGLKLPFMPLMEIDSLDADILAEQFCCDRPDGIPAKLLGLLRDPVRMEYLRSSNIRIFEQYFSPESVADRILNRVL